MRQTPLASYDSREEFDADLESLPYYSKDATGCELDEGHIDVYSANGYWYTTYGVYSDGSVRT